MQKRRHAKIIKEVDADIKILHKKRRGSDAVDALSDAEIVALAKKNVEQYHAMSSWERFKLSFRVPNDVRRAEAIVDRLAIDGKVNPDAEMSWFVYDQGKPTTLRQHYARFRAIQVGIKYRLFRPIMFFLDRYLKKHYKGVPSHPYNRPMVALDRAFDRAILEWHIHFLRMVYSKQRIHPVAAFVHTSKGFAGNDLRILKETYLAICMMDTAYREFHNILMFNIVREMEAEYRESIERDGVVKHLFYTTSNAFDASYFYIHKCLKTGVQKMYGVEKSHCCDERYKLDAVKKAKFSDPNYWGFEFKQ